MNHIKNRKYARTTKKTCPTFEKNDETEYTLSTTMALGILGGTFLIGMTAGHLLGRR